MVTTPLVHEELPKENEDPLIRVLHRIIRVCVSFSRFDDIGHHLGYWR